MKRGVKFSVCALDPRVPIADPPYVMTTLLSGPIAAGLPRAEIRWPVHPSKRPELGEEFTFDLIDPDEAAAEALRIGRTVSSCSADAKPADELTPQETAALSADTLDRALGLACNELETQNLATKGQSRTKENLRRDFIDLAKPLFIVGECRSRPGTFCVSSRAGRIIAEFEGEPNSAQRARDYAHQRDMADRLQEHELRRTAA